MKLVVYDCSVECDKVELIKGFIWASIAILRMSGGTGKATEMAREEQSTKMRSRCPPTALASIMGGEKDLRGALTLADARLAENSYVCA